MQILGLAHVAITVTDMDRSKQFYGETLGLQSIHKPTHTVRNASFAIGEQHLDLIFDPDMLPASRRHHHFSMMVDDVDKAKIRLESKGVAILRGPVKRDDGTAMVFFTDPDGYLIELISRPR